jgi:hypothetical protein
MIVHWSAQYGIDLREPLAFVAVARGGFGAAIGSACRRRA